MEVMSERLFEWRLMKLPAFFREYSHLEGKIGAMSPLWTSFIQYSYE